MESKDKNQLDLLEKLKKQKLAELFGEDESKGIEEEPVRKKINFRRTVKAAVLFFLLILVVSVIGMFVFLWQKYMEFQRYVHENSETIRLGEIYKDEQAAKERWLDELKDLTLQNVNSLPDERKEVMLNIIPSGSPLKRKLEVTSPFGTRSHPVSGRTREHHGIDLRVNIGDEVTATAAGKVSFAGIRGGYGYTVIIDHMYGFQTLYAHLDKIHVSVGEITGKGKVIADGGNSGVSTGPHLHYEIRYNNTPIDPENFINWDKKNFNILFEKERSIQWEYFLTIMGKN